VSGRWVSDHVLRVLDGMIQDYWFCGSLEMEVLQISCLCLSGKADLMLRGVKPHDRAITCCDMSDQSAGTLSSGLEWKLLFRVNEILYDILRDSVLFAVCSDENSSHSRDN
jgi:hypothetical protein